MRPAATRKVADMAAKRPAKTTAAPQAQDPTPAPQDDPTPAAVDQAPTDPTPAAVDPDAIGADLAAQVIGGTAVDALTIPDLTVDQAAQAQGAAVDALVAALADAPQVGALIRPLTDRLTAAALAAQAPARSRRQAPVSDPTADLADALAVIDAARAQVIGAAILAGAQAPDGFDADALAGAMALAALAGATPDPRLSRLVSAALPRRRNGGGGGAPQGSAERAAVGSTLTYHGATAQVIDGGALVVTFGQAVSVPAGADPTRAPAVDYQAGQVVTFASASAAACAVDGVRTGRNGHRCWRPAPAGADA